MSRVLTYSTYLSSIGSPNGTTYLNQPIQLNPNRPHYLKIIDCAISTQIPNVYNYGGVNNGLVSVSRDDGVTWTDVQLTDGVYSVNQIQNAINEAVSSWWTDVADPGILIRSNTALKKNYLVLDSTKLKAPGTQLRIDFSVSNIWELLGFSATKVFIVDGTYTGDVYPQVDWWGQKIVVLIHGFGPVTIKNGNSSDEAFRINCPTSTDILLYTFPQTVQPSIIISPPNQIVTYSVEVVGSRGRPIYLLEGEFDLSFEIQEL